MLYYNSNIIYKSYTTLCMQRETEHRIRSVLFIGAASDIIREFLFQSVEESGPTFFSRR